MSLVWDQGPGTGGGLRGRKKGSQALKKILPVIVILEYLASLDSPENYMVQIPGSIQLGLS